MKALQSQVIAKPGGSFQGSGSSTVAQQSECFPKMKSETPVAASVAENERNPTIPAPTSVDPFVHTLSGTFSNCTINISMKRLWDFLWFVLSCFLCILSPICVISTCSWEDIVCIKLVRTTENIELLLINMEFLALQKSLILYGFIQ